MQCAKVTTYANTQRKSNPIKYENLDYSLIREMFAGGTWNC